MGEERMGSRREFQKGKLLLFVIRASDISRGRGPAKFRYFREIPRNPSEIFPNTRRQNIFNTYLG